MDRQLTTATGADGRIVGPGDPHAHPVQALKKIDAVLGAAGASMSPVGRIRMLVTSIDQWDENEAVLP
jgi:enamine deaminase RidA (YjgF/YER057c/UK114 family)